MPFKHTAEMGPTPVMLQAANLHKATQGACSVKHDRTLDYNFLPFRPLFSVPDSFSSVVDSESARSEPLAVLKLEVFETIIDNLDFESVRSLRLVSRATAASIAASKKLKLLDMHCSEILRAIYKVDREQSLPVGALLNLLKKPQCSTCNQLGRYYSFFTGQRHCKACLHCKTPQLAKLSFSHEATEDDYEDIFAALTSLTVPASFLHCDAHHFNDRTRQWPQTMVDLLQAFRTFPQARKYPYHGHHMVILNDHARLYILDPKIRGDIRQWMALSLPIMNDDGSAVQWGYMCPACVFERGAEILLREDDTAHLRTYGDYIWNFPGQHANDLRHNLDAALPETEEEQRDVALWRSLRANGEFDADARPILGQMVYNLNVILRQKAETERMQLESLGYVMI